MKDKSILDNLPKLVVWFAHNVSKFNAQVLSVTRSLKRNGSSAPDLLHQLFLASLTCLDAKSNAYIILKQNSFEESLIFKLEYLMRCARYRYCTLVERGGDGKPQAYRRG